MTVWERVMLRVMPWYHRDHADERDLQAEAARQRAIAVRVHLERHGK